MNKTKWLIAIILCVLIIVVAAVILLNQQPNEQADVPSATTETENTGSAANETAAVESTASVPEDTAPAPEAGGMTVVESEDEVDKTILTDGTDPAPEGEEPAGSTENDGQSGGIDDTSDQPFGGLE